MKELLVIFIFLAATAAPFPYPLRPNHFTRHLLNDVEETNEPPKAKKLKHESEMFGDVRVDNYYWLGNNNGSDPNVLSYINEENNYTALIMSDTKQLQDQIYAEISAKINEDDISAPRRRGPYYYYERTLAGNNYYYQFCRRLAPSSQDPPSVYDVMPTGPDAAPEHVILDMSLRAKGHIYYEIGAFTVSPNHKLVAFAEDTKGDENYTAYIIDADSRNLVGKSLVGLTYRIVWVGNEVLLYTTMDSNRRQNKAWLHKVGEEQSNDLCIYDEIDATFSVRIVESESRKFVFVGSISTDTGFFFYLDIAKPEQGLIPLTPRIDGIVTSVNHRGTHFLIKRTSDEIYNSELLACPVDNVSATTVILAHRKSVTITSVQLFSNHLVLFERENGLTKVIIYNLPPPGEPIQMLQRPQDVEFMDTVYAVYRQDSEFCSNILRFYYGTLRTPNTVFDYDMNTRTSVIKKIETVFAGFDSSNYFTERKWATAPDGIQVPMSIVYKKDLVKLNGSNPLLLYGYGEYGVSIDPYFRTSVLPFLDRGFIFAIAHVRGGGEMGSQWYKNGKLLKKKNTFSDFIACAEYLMEMKYTTNEKLVINGYGLLIGVIVNMRPNLFKAAIAEYPILDVVTTLLDQPIPDIKSELEEYGDPRKKEFYNYIKSYSPVDNVSAKKYPSILVTTANYPSRLNSEAAKFVAKMRDLKTDKNMLLFKCEVGEESTESWRSKDLKEYAFKVAFILKDLNMIS